MNIDINQINNPDPQKRKRTFLVVIAVFFLAFAYAVIRYVVIGPYDINAIPLFIMNKAFAFSFVILLFIVNLHQIQSLDRALLGLMIYSMAILHLLLSAVLLPTTFFKTIFNSEGEILFSGASMVLFGIITFIFTVLISKVFFRAVKDMDYGGSFKFEKLFFVFLTFLGLHLSVFHATRWFDVDSWYGHLPPISLLSFLFVLATAFQFFKYVFHKEK